MGAPYFQYKKILKSINACVCSSNYSLYQNMSERVMDELRSFGQPLEVYSIDEAFINLTGLLGEGETFVHAHHFAVDMKKRIEKNVAIPISIGLGRTRTLTKIAAEIAKKSNKAKGVVSLESHSLETLALQRVEVENVWGVGKKISQKLHAISCKTALDLRDHVSSEVLRKIGGKRLCQTQQELKGISCIQLNHNPKKKGILSSRSFGHKVNDIGLLKEAIAYHIEQASRRLRKQGSRSHLMECFLLSRDYQAQLFLTFSQRFSFSLSTNDPGECTQQAWQWIDQIKDEIKNVYFTKAGVSFSEIVDVDQLQLNLFERSSSKREQLIKAQDQIKERFGSGLIGGVGVIKEREQRDWHMSNQFRSPSYTTCLWQAPRLK